MPKCMFRCPICDNEEEYRGIDSRDGRELPCKNCQDVIDDTVQEQEPLEDIIPDFDTFRGGVEDFS